MEPFEAQKLACELLQRHGLAGWSFAFDHARRRFGSCQWGKKRITLSRTLTILNGVEQVRETILHEIAHALTPGDGHGQRWRAKCLEIGAKPQRCYRDQEVLSPPRKAAAYLIGCKVCGWWADRRRVTRRRLICRACRHPVVYRDKFGGVEFLAGSGPSQR